MKQKQNIYCSSANFCNRLKEPAIQHFSRIAVLLSFIAGVHTPAIGLNCFIFVMILQATLCSTACFHLVPLYWCLSWLWRCPTAARLQGGARWLIHHDGRVGQHAVRAGESIPVPTFISISVRGHQMTSQSSDLSFYFLTLYFTPVVRIVY